jgi:hypothetical protein
MMPLSDAMPRPDDQTKAAMVNAAVPNPILFCAFISIPMTDFEFRLGWCLFVTTPAITKGRRVWKHNYLPSQCSTSKPVMVQITAASAKHPAAGLGICNPQVVRSFL